MIATRLLSLLAPLLALALAVAPIGAQEPGEDPAAAFARALDSVRADRILADVSYVACDDMGGRDTPSTGQRLTARFLKNRLQRLGWKPGAREGWFHTYPLAWKRVKEPETRVLVRKGEEKLELEFGKDYFFTMRDLETLDLTAGVVYCGRGSPDELAAAPAVKGRWALCFGAGERSRALEEALRGAGAAGVLLVQSPDPDARPFAEDFAPWLGSLRAGRATWPDGPDSRRPPFFPRLYLPKETGDRVIALAGVGELVVGAELPIRVTDVRRLHGDGKVTCENVCAYWPGSDPELRKEAVLISAHYDHVGIGADGQVFNGADDNASGTCGLLALAEALVFQGPLRRSVLLVWVSGEEKGLYGSQAWASAPWLPDDGRAIADINIDMIGRNAPNQILLTPSRDHSAYNGLSRLAESIAPLEGFTEIGSADTYYTRSDHANFARLGIPITFLFTNVHADYHKPTDDPEKIDSDKIRRVVRLVLRMLNEMQADQLALGK